jgi:enoyl-CoA hydratase
MIQMIGLGRVKEMVMTALPVTAEQALHMGLVTRVCEPDALDAETQRFVQLLMARAPLAMGMAKHIINTCQSVDLETGRVLERLGQSLLIRSDDNKEGMAAFRAKRKARFKGR